MGTKDRSRPALSSSSSSPCSPSGSVLPHSDRLSPKELKMASPNRSSVVSAPAAPASQSVLVQSRKSSLAFILTGNQECDGDGQEDDEEDEQEDAKGHEYGSYQQEYVARHSFYESHGHSSQFSRRQEHTQQHHHSRPQQHAQYFHQHQQQYRHQECQPQRSQLRYPPPTSAPAASFSSTPHMRPSFPLEVRPEPPRSPFESGRWAETQPRKKVRARTSAERDLTEGYQDTNVLTSTLYREASSASCRGASVEPSTRDCAGSTVRPPSLMVTSKHSGIQARR